MDMKKAIPDIDRVWLKSYPAGVPADIQVDQYASLIEMFDESCRLHRDRDAFYFMGKMLTYADLARLTRDMAAYFQQVWHLQKGDRIAIMLPNTLQYPVVMYAALKAGLVVVNVNPLYTAHELAYQLENAEVSAIVTLANFADTVASAMPRVPSLKQVMITYLGDLLSPWKSLATHLVLKYFYKKIPDITIPSAVFFKAALRTGSAQTFSPIYIEPKDTAFLQYTGGTTGVSKGAVLSHYNMLANLAQGETWFASLLTDGQEIIITPLPLYHIFSLFANCIFFTKLGGLNVLIPDPRNIPSMIRDMRQFQFTGITGVNTLFSGLLKDPGFASLDFSRLRLTLGGGMAVQRVIAEKWQAITHSPLLEAYGLTETSPCVTINPPSLKAYNGTIGLPIPSTYVGILDEQGKMLPLGEAGELAVKGPQVMEGYWRNPLETAKVFTPDGWLLTGDIASMDEQGYVRILERKKDMILVSGFNVYPNEIENVLVRMPGVRECAVIGVPDEHSGEAVKAFIVSDDPALTKEAVVTYSRSQLTPYKVPRQVAFVSELPKSNVGKILRRALRESAQTEQNDVSKIT